LFFIFNYLIFKNIYNNIIRLLLNGFSFFFIYLNKLKILNIFFKYLIIKKIIYIIFKDLFLNKIYYKLYLTFFYKKKKKLFYNKLNRLNKLKESLYIAIYNFIKLNIKNIYVFIYIFLIKLYKKIKAYILKLPNYYTKFKK
jgi:hypothetical protein